MKQIHILLFTFIALFYSSCDKNRVYEKNTELPDYVWNKNNPKEFEFDIIDTSAFYNIIINLRHTPHYPYSNIYIHYTLETPAKKLISDLYNLILADVEAEKWLGDQLVDIIDLSSKIDKFTSYKFSASGKYKIRLEQYMRDDNLIGVMEVGIRVEKIQNED